METSYSEFTYVGLIFGLFIVPKILERFYLPAGLSAFFIGIISALGFGLFLHDSTITVLAILGISALFLFAGLEVNLNEMKQNATGIIQNMALQSVLMILVMIGLHNSLDLSFRAACLYSLALVTPSTGFILDSMASHKLTKEQNFSVKTNAIATEILALFLMFIILQSASPSKLAISSLGLILLIAAVPLIFLVFVKKIAPYAPDSEFAFFMMLAVLAGVVTAKLGAYYLVGAFVVGISIQRFKDLFPLMNIESMIHSLKVFSAFFIPFYFFKAGSKVSATALNPSAIILGLLLVAIIAPIRIFMVVTHRKFSTQESYKERLEVALSMTPTLVFGLVLAEILRTEYGISPTYFGALVTYTVMITFIPGLIIKKMKLHRANQSTTSEDPLIS